VWSGLGDRQLFFNASGKREAPSVGPAKPKYPPRQAILSGKENERDVDRFLNLVKRPPESIRVL
jgi:hypothetical protein